MDGGRRAELREEMYKISQGEGEKSLGRRGVNGSNEGEEWTLKICVSVFMSALFEQTDNLRRTKPVRLALEL